LYSASSTLLSEKTAANTLSGQTLTNNLKYDSQPKVNQQAAESEASSAKGGRSNIVTNLGDKDFGANQNLNKKKNAVPPLGEKEDNFEIPPRKGGILKCVLSNFQVNYHLLEDRSVRKTYMIMI